MKNTPIIVLLLAFISAFMACDQRTVGSKLTYDEDTGDIVIVTEGAQETSAATTAPVPQTTTVSTTTEAADTQPPEVSEPVQVFESINDYFSWAEEVGYPSGLLQADGINGLNQDYFHSAPDTAAYNSGRIVIGDSRCCQLGINQYRHGWSDFAVFGVWGGHYSSGYGGILTEGHFRDVESCFRSQIMEHGECRIYLFATVNDYDCWSNDNYGYIYSAISTAERLASMSCEINGVACHPEVTVIGFDGCWLTGDLYGTPQETFNRYIQDYNDSLRGAWSASSLLGGGFTTVPEIVGGKAGFIDDGLHYSDDTLEMITGYILSTD